MIPVNIGKMPMPPHTILSSFEPFVPWSFFAPQRAPRSVQLPAICFLTNPVKIPPEQDDLWCETFVSIAVSPAFMGVGAVR